MIQRFRRAGGCEYVTKQEALRQITRKFVAGRNVGLLPDVRVDSGPDLDLFGRGAPTTVSPPRLAARLDYLMVPVRVVRTGPAQFDIEFHPPLTARHALLGKRAAIDVMAQFNELLESWISEHPDQWLCAKRRWPKADAHNGV
jgi:KDO2-lipid IV(A) lauroyltransferase